MKKIVSIFFKEILALAPTLLTYIIVYKISGLIQVLFKNWLKLTGFYSTWAGALTMLGIIFITGLLVTNWAANKPFKFFNELISKTPLIGSIYSIIKDTLKSLSSDKKGFSNLVMIKLPNGLKLLGFLTNDKNKTFIPKGHVSIYLMQSMQWAGNLVFVPKVMVEPIDASA